MDLKHVRYFVAVAEHLHFGRAAERMNVVQPAISQQIKRFEEELGTRLFERSGNEVRLTEVGRQMLPECRRLIWQAEETLRIANAAKAGTRGHIDFAFVDNSICSLLPPLIRSFRDRYPEVEIALHTLNRDEQRVALSERRIDIGLMPGPGPIVGLETETVISAPLVIALPAMHRLAKHASLPLQALADERFVLFPAGMRARLLELIIAACAEAGFTPRAAQVATQIHTLLALVDAGLGVTLVPAWVAQAGVHQVKFVPIDPVGPIYELLLAWRSDNSNMAVSSMCAISQALSKEAGVPPR